MVQNQNNMSKKLFFASLICFIFIFMLPMTGLAMTGTGTSADPYMIYNATDLQNIKNNLSANYKLANNIDLSGVSFVPISNFNGTLDGAGYTIKNIKIYSDADAGLFGFTPGGIIKNLKLTVKEVVASSTFAGALVAYGEGTRINNVHIRKVDNDSIIWAGESAGGLVGQIEQGTITNCSSNIDVSSSEVVGGLIGTSSASTIDKSYATGNITVEGYGAGGFVGNMFSSDISNSYALGNVSGDMGIGGFMAFANGDNGVTKCYSTGNVSGTVNIGGFSGGYYAVNTINNCYYTKSGTISDGKATPMTPEVSLHQSTYLGFDFISIWKIDEGITTPYLKDMPYISSDAGLKNVKVNQDLFLRKFTVTPVASDIKASITVNGQPVNSDSPSQQLTLNSGANIVTIVVTAENGVTTKTYNVTVTGSVDPALPTV